MNPDATFCRRVPWFRLGHTPQSVLGRSRTRHLVVRNHARYPLRYEDEKWRTQGLNLPCRQVGQGGLEPPRGIPDLQSGAVAAVPLTQVGDDGFEPATLSV